MSTLPPPWDPSDDADEQYRRASALDPSRPSEATRRAVLAHAARLAAARERRGALRRWLAIIGAALRGQQAVVGTIAAAVLAGVVIAPQFLEPTAPPASQRAPAAAASYEAPAATAAPAAQHLQDRRLEEGTPSAEPARPARPAVTRERAHHPSSPEPATLGEYGAKTAAPSAPASAPAAGGAMTALQAEQRASSNATLTGAGTEALSRDALGSVERAAPVPRPAPGGPDALRQAAAAGDLTGLKGALASASDIDARDGEGRTALMLATLNGQKDAVAALLAHGADPSGADAHGTTPLQAAVAANEREIIAMLRRYGAR